MKSPVGVIIRQIVEEKNLSISEVSQKMGISRQAMYQVFGRKNMPSEQLERWLNVLGVSSQEFTEKQNASVLSIDKLKDVNSQGDSLMNRILEEIKSLRDQLTKKDEQIAAKDEQISRLFDLLGKLKGICLRPFGQFSTFFFAVN